MPSSKRAVVLMKGFLGDAVMATPLLEGLRAQLSTAVVAPPAIGEILGESWRDSFFPIQGKGLMPLVRALREAQADIVIVLNRSFRSALAARISGIRVRVGHSVEGRGFLLTHRVPFEVRRHETESALDLARALKIELASAPPYLRVTPDELAHGAELLAGADCLLQPGARHAYKRLPSETLIALIPLLRESGLSPVLIGGREEVGDAEAIRSTFPDIPTLVGSCGLRELLGVLGSAKVTIGADTGVMHLAAAVGCPTATVFGPTESASRWGHMYAPHHVLHASQEGMSSIKAADIASAVESTLQQSSRHDQPAEP